MLCIGAGAAGVLSRIVTNIPHAGVCPRLRRRSLVTGFSRSALSASLGSPLPSRTEAGLAYSPILSDFAGFTLRRRR